MTRRSDGRCSSRLTDLPVLAWLKCAGLACATFILAAAAADGSTWFVDNDSIHDPGPNDPAVSDPAEDGSPDHPFDSIQKAIDAASDGDTVVVLPGIYWGPGNRDVDLLGKALVVRSAEGPRECVVRVDASAAQPARGFACDSGEGRATVIDGFTITGGYADYGGGIACDGSSPSILNCVVRGNTAAVSGGGISCSNGAAPLTRNCVIEGNAAGFAGGGIASVESAPDVRNVTVWGNVVDSAGVGEAPVRAHNVKVLSDSVEDVSTLEAFLAEALEPGMTDEEKAIAIWRLVVAFRHQDSPPREYMHSHLYTTDTVKIFNAYGYTFCGPTAVMVVELAHAAGLPARYVSVYSHVVSEVFFGGSWHMLDASMICYFRGPAGEIASALELIDAVQAWKDDHPELVQATGFP